MTYEEIIGKLEHLHSLVSGGGDDSVFTPQQKAWISALHKKETGEPVKDCGCKNKYTDAVVLLLLRLKRRGTAEDERKFRLRAGVLIWLGNDCYSRHNLTDEVAREWLKIHPEGGYLFETKK